MAFLAGLLGIGKALHSGAKTLLANAKVGKQATAAGFISGLSTPQQQQQLAGGPTVGGMSMGLIAGIGAGILLFIAIIAAIISSLKSK